MAKNKDKKVKKNKAVKEIKVELSKKELKAKDKADRKAAAAAGAIPAMSDKEAKSAKKAASDACLKKIKEGKQSNKVDSKAKAPATKEKVNIFTALGLDAKHRTVAFQLPRHFDEVTVARNKAQFPYEAEVLLDSVFTAVLVHKGKASFFSRTGNLFQNLEILGEQFKVKKDGVYMAELSVPELTAAKLNLLFSPFRTNKLTAPQQVTVDDKVQLCINDFITVREFTEGKSERVYGNRKAFVSKAMKKLVKGKSSRFSLPQTIHCDNEDQLLRATDALTKGSYVGINIRGEDNPYVCGHQNFHYMHMLTPIKFNLKCVGFQEGAGKAEGTVTGLVFNYKEGDITVPLGHSYSEDDSIAMLKVLKSDGKGKKKKAKKGKKVKTASSPLGYVWEVNALEVNSKGVMKLPTVGQFTKAKADF